LKRFLSSLLSPEPLGAAPEILVLQLRRIGELVLTTPALHLLRQTWPGAKITLVVSEACLELAPTLPPMDEVLVFHRKLRANYALLKRLLTGSFDVCLDFSGTDRSALFAIASRARRRVAFDWARKGPLRRLVYQNFVGVAVRTQHTVDQMLGLLQPIGLRCKTPEPPLCLTVPPLAERRVKILLRECGVPDHFALLHPGTAVAEKYWLPERWAEVILHLQRKHGMACILTGGSDPGELEHLRTIQTAVAMLGDGPLSLPLVVLAGQLDLTLLTALVARCSLAICCDTAVMHMASAFLRPQISLFGPTNPFEWRPRHALSRIVSASFPSGLTVDFSPDFNGAPMSDIPSLTVCREIDALLETQAPDILAARLEEKGSTDPA
jgi:ADP-heptose:LPS heptosyltransferase